MGVNTYLYNTTHAANLPQTAVWDAEWNRMLTGHPDWT